VTTLFLPFVCIILNVFIVSLSTIALHLRWSYQHSIYDKIILYILSACIVYSASSLLFWYLFPLKDYYSLAFPFGLTLGPILLILTKGSLNDESVKGDWIHLLPSILSLPFYGFFITHSNFRHDHGDDYYSYMY